MPHATNGLERRRSSSQQPSDPVKFKFPDLSQDAMRPSFDEVEYEDISRGPSPSPLPNGLPSGLHSSERWPGRKASQAKSWNSWANGAGSARHGRQKSLSEAIRTVRTRKASISENAHEIAESLKAPVSLKLVVCLLCAPLHILSSADISSRYSVECGTSPPS